MHARRLRAQLLAGPPARDPVAVCERLLAVQAQDLRGARLSVRSRTAGVLAADVDRAMTDDRSLVVTWLNRGTLHLVRAEDVGWLHALTMAPQRTAFLRRLEREGLTAAAAERGVATIERSLADEGPLTRAQLGERVAAAGVRTQGQALVVLLGVTGLRGLTVRGPIVDGEHAYVLWHDWLGEPAPVDRNAALAELARRYLAGHGPADDRDLARWAGIGLRDARAGLGAIGGELHAREDGLVELVRAAAVADGELPPPRLLGPFEPSLLGWCSREAIVGRHGSLVTSNGIFRAFAMVGGRAVGTWRMPDGEVVLEPLEEIGPADIVALETEAADVRRFLRG